MEQLGFLRELFRDAGILHESQVLQLKYWGYLAVPEAVAKAITIRVDMDGKVVFYDVTAVSSTDSPQDPGPRFQALTLAVRDLLGGLWNVRVRVMGANVFDSALESVAAISGTGDAK